MLGITTAKPHYDATSRSGSALPSARSYNTAASARSTAPTELRGTTINQGYYELLRRRRTATTTQTTTATVTVPLPTTAADKGSGGIT